MKRQFLALSFLFQAYLLPVDMREKLENLLNYSSQTRVKHAIWHLFQRTDFTLPWTIWTTLLLPVVETIREDLAYSLAQHQQKVLYKYNLISTKAQLSFGMALF